MINTCPEEWINLWGTLLSKNLTFSSLQQLYSFFKGLLYVHVIAHYIWYVIKTLSPLPPNFFLACFPSLLWQQSKQKSAVFNIKSLLPVGQRSHRKIINTTAGLTWCNLPLPLTIFRETWAALRSDVDVGHRVFALFGRWSTVVGQVAAQSPSGGVALSFSPVWLCKTVQMVFSNKK